MERYKAATPAATKAMRKRRRAAVRCLIDLGEQGANVSARRVVPSTRTAVVERLYCEANLLHRSVRAAADEPAARHLEHKWFWCSMRECVTG